MRAWLLLTLLLLTCCAPLPFAAPPEAPINHALGAAELARCAWPAPGSHYRIRQTVLFELRGARVPMTGLMDLDVERGSIRLVALNDLGVKFFDLQVDRESETLHYLLPELARFPDFGKVVAQAVRHIFLAPRPVGNETLSYRGARYLLSRHDATREVVFEFGGQGPQLLAIEQTGPESDWRIDYYEHHGADIPMPPGGVILNDHRAGYRLTLWLDEVTTL